MYCVRFLVFIYIRVLGTRLFGAILVWGRSVRSAGTLFDPRARCSIRARSDFVGYVSADMTWHDLLPKSGPQIWHKLLTPHFVQRLSFIFEPKPKKKLEEKKEKELNLDQYSCLYIIHTWVLQLRRINLETNKQARDNRLWSLQN
jgi:hypothetical protein